MDIILEKLNAFLGESPGVQLKKGDHYALEGTDTLPMQQQFLLVISELRCCSDLLLAVKAEYDNFVSNLQSQQDTIFRESNQEIGVDKSECNKKLEKKRVPQKPSSDSAQVFHRPRQTITTIRNLRCRNFKTKPSNVDWEKVGLVIEKLKCSSNFNLLEAISIFTKAFEEVAIELASNDLSECASLLLSAWRGHLNLLLNVAKASKKESQERNMSLMVLADKETFLNQIKRADKRIEEIKVELSDLDKKIEEMKLEFHEQEKEFRKLKDNENDASENLLKVISKEEEELRQQEQLEDRSESEESDSFDEFDDSEDEEERPMFTQIISGVFDDNSEAGSDSDLDSENSDVSAAPSGRKLIARRGSILSNTSNGQVEDEEESLDDDAITAEDLEQLRTLFCKCINTSRQLEDLISRLRWNMPACNVQPENCREWEELPEREIFVKPDIPLKVRKKKRRTFALMAQQRVPEKFYDFIKTITYGVTRVKKKQVIIDDDEADADPEEDPENGEEKDSDENNNSEEDSTFRKTVNIPSVRFTSTDYTTEPTWELSSTLRAITRIYRSWVAESERISSKGEFDYSMSRSFPEFVYECFKSWYILRADTELKLTGFLLSVRKYTNKHVGVHLFDHVCNFFSQEEKQKLLIVLKDLFSRLSYFETADGELWIDIANATTVAEKVVEKEKVLQTMLADIQSLAFTMTSEAKHMINIGDFIMLMAKQWKAENTGILYLPSDTNGAKLSEDLQGNT